MENVADNSVTLAIIQTIGLIVLALISAGTALGTILLNRKQNRNDRKLDVVTKQTDGMATTIKQLALDKGAADEGKRRDAETAVVDKAIVGERERVAGEAKPLAEASAAVAAAGVAVARAEGHAEGRADERADAARVVPEAPGEQKAGAS